VGHVVYVGHAHSSVESCIVVYVGQSTRLDIVVVVVLYDIHACMSNKLAIGSESIFALVPIALFLRVDIGHISFLFLPHMLILRHRHLRFHLQLFLVTLLALPLLFRVQNPERY